MEATTKVIYWLINDSGMSQTEIAKQTGVSISTISRVKSGDRQVRDMRFGNIIKLEELATKTKKRI